MPVSNSKDSKLQSGNYLKFIAYLQVIGIILVVLGHSFHEYPDGSMGKNMLLYRMLFSFRMPLFMFVSGFLMIYTTKMRNHSSGTSIKSFISKKIQRLLIPFIVLTLITFLPRALMSGLADDTIELSMESFWKAFVFAEYLPIPFFWFLQASFILLIFNYTVITLGEKAGLNNIFLFSVIILLFLFLQLGPINFGTAFSLYEVARLGVYFATGAAYARFADKIDRFLPWTSITFFLTLASVWTILFFTTEKTSMVSLCSFTGILMCISLAKIMEARDIHFIDHLIGANYLIFLLSWFCNVATQQILHHFVELPWWCYTVLSIISGIYVPWLCYKYLQSNPDSRWVKVTAFLLGQSLNKKKPDRTKA